MKILIKLMKCSIIILTIIFVFLAILSIIKLPDPEVKKYSVGDFVNASKPPYPTLVLIESLYSGPNKQVLGKVIPLIPDEAQDIQGPDRMSRADGTVSDFYFYFSFSLNGKRISRTYDKTLMLADGSMVAVNEIEIWKGEYLWQEPEDISNKSLLQILLKKYLPMLSY